METTIRREEVINDGRVGGPSGGAENEDENDGGGGSDRPPHEECGKEIEDDGGSYRENSKNEAVAWPPPKEAGREGVGESDGSAAPPAKDAPSTKTHDCEGDTTSSLLNGANGNAAEEEEEPAHPGKKAIATDKGNDRRLPVESRGGEVDPDDALKLDAFLFGRLNPLAETEVAGLEDSDENGEEREGGVGSKKEGNDATKMDEGGEPARKRKGKDQETSSAKKMKENNGPSTSSQAEAIIMQQQQQNEMMNLQNMMNVKQIMNAHQVANPQEMINAHQMVPNVQQIMNAQQVINVQNMMNSQQVLNTQSSQQMLNVQQMLNAQGMTWHQLMPPTLGMQAINMATAQWMMGGASGTNVPHSVPVNNPTPPIPPDVTCHFVSLTLPSPSTKLGIMLENNCSLGLPELKSVAANSPVRKQIPKKFHSGYCILSLNSEATGCVRVNTAQHCVMLISSAQKGGAKPVKLDIVFVQSNKHPAKMNRTPATPSGGTMALPMGDLHRLKNKKGRKNEEEKREFDQKKRAALLDFFSDESRPSVYHFCKGQYGDGMRSTMARIIKLDQRLLRLVDQRCIPARRAEAYEIIEEMFPDTTAEKAIANQAKKTALLDFFRDPSRRTMPTFCYERKLGHKMRIALEKIIDGNARLSKLVDQRNIPERLEEAYEIIEKKILPDTSVKEASEKIAFEKAQKTALLDFFSDSACTSLKEFCKNSKLDANMQPAMRRFIDKDKRLVKLVEMRNIADRREEAINLLEKLLSNIHTKYSKTKEMEQPKEEGEEKDEGEERDAPNANVAAVDSLKAKQQVWDFFTPNRIIHTASGLDFEARPRMTRDGSKEIAVHDRKMPDEILMLLIFDLNNRVVKGRVLTSKDKNAVLGNCAKILFYDHGYKKVYGKTTLDRTWEARLENAYITGADASPLNRRYEGGVSYTDKIEKDHPGLIARLSEYTEGLIGQGASYAEKAMFMNEKSMEDAFDDPSLPVLQMNSTNLCRWTQQQQLSGSAEGSAQATAEGELSVAQISKRHPGLIEELYAFAVEALGPDASYHMLATCMNERSKEDAEEDPTIPLVTVSKTTLPTWMKKKGLLV